MRLINADALKTDLTRFYDNEVTAKRLIDEQPTIPAIPVEWLKTQGERGSVVWLVADMLIERWQKEQEAEEA